MPSVRWTTGVTILTVSGGLHACVKAVTPVAQTTSTTTATNDVMRVAVSRDVAAVLGVSIVDVPIVQYRATGQTWDEIRSSWGDRDFPGLTNYRFGYHPETHFEGGECKVDRLNPTWSIRVELPAWDAPPDVDPAVTARWDRFIGEARHHESGHVQIALEAYAAMARAMEQTRCDDLG